MEIKPHRKTKDSDLYDSSLISAIYDATIDDSKWQDVVDIMSARIPGTTTSIVRHNLEPVIEANILYSGFDPKQIDNYQAYFKNINPVLNILKKKKSNSHKKQDIIFRTSDISDTEYYNDYLKPQEVKKGIHVKLKYSENELLTFSKLIKEDEDGKVTAESLLQTHTYLPHISRAIQIYRHLSSAGINIRNLENTLDSLAVSVFVISNSQAVTYSNLAAQKLLTTSAALRIDRFNHIQASHHPSDEQLQAAIVFAQSNPYPSPPVKIHRSDNKHPLIAIALRYDCESAWQSKFNKLFSDRTENICLFVFEPVARVVSQNKIIASSFNLTPAQVRLTQALAQGALLQDYANQIGISRNTARNHLAAIMKKMSISRQSELISIVAQLSTIDYARK